MNHVLSRGDRREAIFHDVEDRQLFLATLGEACAKTGLAPCDGGAQSLANRQTLISRGEQVHALCLMLNHFHLVLETPQANLVSGMKWFLGTYTGRFNRRHKLFGHLFSGRYKALVVDESGGG